MLQYKNETVETFKKLYTERKDTIEYLEKFGNRFEKAQAMLIKEIAYYGFKGCSNVVQTQQPFKTSIERPQPQRELGD